jgi:hypothetical protein
MASRSTASSDQNTASRRSKEAAKARAKVKFNAVEATLPQSMRLDSDTRDWDAIVLRQLSLSRQDALDSMKEWFLDFVTDEDLPLRYVLLPTYSSELESVLPILTLLDI